MDDGGNLSCRHKRSSTPGILVTREIREWNFLCWPFAGGLSVSLCRERPRGKAFLAGGLDLAAGELAEEVDGAGAGLADQVDERAVGVEDGGLRLGGEGGHRHDGGCHGGGLRAFFTHLDLGLLEHLRHEHIPVGEIAEVGGALEHRRCAEGGDDIVQRLLGLGRESWQLQIDLAGLHRAAEVG